MSFGKVRPEHVKKKAIVYVRQSSPDQVREHVESQERQYNLRKRACELGWPEVAIEVIDEDLGKSGRSRVGRSGFDRLVMEVGLGKVGILLGLEVSRLARNNRDWYQLLDLCALTDTLIADQDGVYHPAAYNDRLLLGLKGTMSEAELHIMKGRLDAGLRHKAQKGELILHLPAGYERGPEGTIEMTKDEAERDAIRTVFKRFCETGSIRQTMCVLRDEGIRLPRRYPADPQTRWEEAVYGAVHAILTNPVYAGAYVFGRTVTVWEAHVGEGIREKERRRERKDWPVVIPDHHEGYITWQEFLANQETIRRNTRPRRGDPSGAVREGPALLQGLIRCGRCGRTMRVSYSGPSGQVPRYSCSQAIQMQGLTTCQSVGGRRVEGAAVEAVFSVLTPQRLQMDLKTLRELQGKSDQADRQLRFALERAEYEAERAARQYHSVEPENRLVARTLEKRWNEKLGEVERIKKGLEARRVARGFPLSNEELAAIARIPVEVRRLWEAPTTDGRDRKRLVRALLQEVIVTVDKDRGMIDLKLVWKGGAATTLEVKRTGVGQHRYCTDEDTVGIVRNLAKQFDDLQIARVLNVQGRRTGHGHPFTKSRVQSLRSSHSIPMAPPRPFVPGQRRTYTAAQAAKELGVTPCTVYRWLDQGLLSGKQTTRAAPWEIEITQEDRKRLRGGGAPEGWLGIKEAAKVLGWSVPTVLQKVKSGELKAIRETKGKRVGLRIDVSTASCAQQPGLFAASVGQVE